MSSEDFKIRHDQITPELLDRFPVWGGHEQDDSEIMRPVAHPEPFETDCDPLMIRADFETANGRLLSGCVVVDRAFNEVYYLGVFVADEWLGFNISLRDIASRQLEKLAMILGEEKRSIFPMHFGTGTVGPTGARFCGNFSPFG